MMFPEILMICILKIALKNIWKIFPTLFHNWHHWGLTMNGNKSQVIPTIKLNILDFAINSTNITVCLEDNKKQVWYHSKHEQ